MSATKKYFQLIAILFFLFVHINYKHQVFAKNAENNIKSWYCDSRLNLDLRVGTVLKITPYRKKADFTVNNNKYKAVETIKFQTFDLYTNEKQTETEEFINVRDKTEKAFNFRVGEKYLFEVNSFSLKSEQKYSDTIFLIKPAGFIKIFADAKEDIEFLQRTNDLDEYREILGTDEGEILPGANISSKFAQFVKPVYPQELKPKKITEFVQVMVLIGEDGKVLKAKAFCYKNAAFAESAEKAALASKLSPISIKNKPVKIKGVITYNFVP